MRTIIRNNYDPNTSDYHETIVIDDEREKKWLFDCDGVFTDITSPKVVSEAGDSEDYAASQKWVTGIQGDLADETQNRIDADGAIWTEIENIEMSSDVVDIVGTYAELQQYDTSKLHDNDIIKVLQDSTHQDETAYYRWSTATSTFSYVGSEGPYYTESEIDTMMSGKQDKLIAGSNIQIAADGKTISATDTTYTHFTGATALADGVQGLVPGPLAGDQGKYLKGDGTWGEVSLSVIFYASAYPAPPYTQVSLYKDAALTDKATWGEVYDAAIKGNAVIQSNLGYESIYWPVVGAHYEDTDNNSGWYQLACSDRDKNYVFDSVSVSVEATDDADGRWEIFGPFLDSIPTASFSTLGGVKVGSNLTISDGVLSAKNMTGATSSANGAAGYVPAPLIADVDKFLKADGTWSVVDPGGTIFYFKEVQTDFFTFYTDSACTTVAKLQDMFDAMNKGSIYVQRVDSDTANLADKYIYPLSLHMEVDKTLTPAEVTNLSVAFSDFSGVSVLSGWNNPTHLSDNMSSLTITYTPYVTSLPAANASTAGIGKLYTTTGQNTDGAVTQKLFTDTVGDIETALQILNSGAGVPNNP